MDTDRGPEVVVNLQEQRHTLCLSDEVFESMTATAADRIQAYQTALEDAANDTGRLASQITKLSAILEEEPIEQSATGRSSWHDSSLQHNCTSSIPHPGEPFMLSPRAPFTDRDSDNACDTASDITTITNITQLTIKQPKSFYKDVDMREIAPWLYQEEDTQSARAKCRTPPSSLGRASRAGKLMPWMPTQTLEESADDEISISHPFTFTPKLARSWDRKSSLTSVVTSSPRSSLHKIRSRISLANLRKQSTKLGSTFDSETTAPFDRSCPFPIAESEDDSPNSRIGCSPYRDHDFGPAPLIHSDLRSRRDFRPLSAITTAINFPFKPLPAMDEIISGMTKDDKKMQAKLSATQRIESADSDEYAATTPSTDGTVITLHEPASILFNTTPPLLADHPLNQEGELGFMVRTDYPLMTTSTPASVIRTLAKKNQLCAERVESVDGLLSSKSAGFADDLHKKKSYRNLLPMSAPPTRMTYGSEVSMQTAVRSAARASNESPPTPASLTSTLTFESEDSRRKGMRKISTLFSRSSKESESPMEPVRESGEVGKRKREQSITKPPTETTESRSYIEQFIRNHLAYQHKDYQLGEWPHYPPHPNNRLRAWDHANLRCKTCIEGFCGCCGKTCCAHRAMTVRLGLFSKDSEANNGLKEMLAQVIPDRTVRSSPKVLTKEVRDSIEHLRPASGGRVVGGETTTFLQCTECKKMVCPDCCGICPLEGCGDTECRKCKDGDAWGPCKWHEEGQRSWGHCNTEESAMIMS